MAATGVNKMAAMVGFFSGVLPWVFFIDLDGCHKSVVALLLQPKNSLFGIFQT